jgi:hypothetical protein
MDRDPQHFERRAGLPSLVDWTPPTVRPSARMSRTARLVLLARPLWAWRVELAGVGLLWLLLGLLAGRLGVQVAGLLVSVALGVLLAVPGVRDWTGGLLARARVRRAWELAVRYANLVNFNDRIPRLVGYQQTLSGDRLLIRVPKGTTVSEVERESERLAACLDVPKVRVSRSPSSASLAVVQIVRRDPLAAPLPWPWPHLDAPRLSLWQPIPVGLDDEGRLVTVSLPERNVLIGGEPGAGKSVANSMLVATAALDPMVRLILLDGARVELSVWRGCADRFVGPSPEEALEVFEGLRVELDERLELLDSQGRRKIAPEVGLPLIVVVIDEKAFYLHTGKRQLDQAIIAALRDVLMRGRKTGIIVLAATQKPSGAVVPTELRDQFSVRWAFRCTAPDASDTILGRGWATQGYSAATIDLEQRGVSLLLAEGALPRRLRTFYLTDQELLALAGRAARLRTLASGAPGVVPPFGLAVSGPEGLSSADRPPYPTPDPEGR